VKAYHGELEKLKLKPYRDLKSDMELTTTATSYAGTGSSVSLTGSATKAQDAAKSGDAAKAASAPAVAASFPTTAGGAPDFKKMTPAQKLAYSRQRIQSDLTKSGGNGRG
jgi:hypothetical protein